jgi:hypothetical protein
MTATMDVRIHSEASSAYRSTRLYVSGHRRELVRTHPAQLRPCPESIEPLPCERRALHGPGQVGVQSSTHPDLTVA